VPQQKNAKAEGKGNEGESGSDQYFSLAVWRDEVGAKDEEQIEPKLG